jgi:hypothetical protein
MRFWACFGFVKNNLKFKAIPFPELGWTEDEYNNMLIDCWKAANGKADYPKRMFQLVDGATFKVMKSDKPITVTIQLSSKDWLGCEK